MADIARRWSYSALAVVLAICLIVIAILFTAPRHVSSQSGSMSVTGYAWSDMIGWIGLSGLSIDGSGNVTGYAWSDNIGWIKFGGLSGFPTGSGTSAQNVQLTGNNLIGWARACAGTAPGDCSSMTSRTDGWDGWISLSGSGYGPTVSNGLFSGYAWGDTNVGWVDFEYASTTYGTCSLSYSCSGQQIQRTDPSCVVSNVGTPCVTPQFCFNGSPICVSPAPIFVQNGSQTGHLQLAPLIVPTGTPVTAHWDIQNVSSCTVSGDDNETLFSGACPGNTCTSGLSGVTTAPIETQTIFTLSCTGLDSSVIHETETVNIVPIFKER